MKRLLALCLVACLAGAAYAETTAILQGIKGKVEVKALGKDWVAAKENMVVNLLATISTGFDSSATLVIGQNKVRLEPLTRLTVDKILEKSGSLGTSLHLRVGKVSASVKSSAGVSQDFKVTSPYSTASVRGTEFERDPYSVIVNVGVVELMLGRPIREFVAQLAQQGPEGTPAADAGLAGGVTDDGMTPSGNVLPPEAGQGGEPIDMALAAQQILAFLAAEFPDDDFSALDASGIEFVVEPLPAPAASGPPPTGTPPAGTAPAETPPAGTAPAETPPAGTAPAETPPTETPPTPTPTPSPTPTPTPTPRPVATIVVVMAGQSAQIKLNYSAPRPTSTGGGTPPPTTPASSSVATTGGATVVTPSGGGGGATTGGVTGGPAGGSAGGTTGGTTVVPVVPVTPVTPTVTPTTGKIRINWE